ncbi:KTSC domain-containing protein [Aureispira sp. CCB-E]|uniref:KTSC domain-containing protein n=1 Tax=Aureispira sp. CCB-E TaxID=3051121 RepID=UPI00286930DC|nr:KTSC domain-containing protein [Aureispira sp. CCB-E]WMX17567.1 KTSC domain-containing protein [Aureispira sp. CCB-E]
MIEVTLIPVDSSMISAIGYDADSQTLFAEFATTDKIYAYEEVEQEIFEELQQANSVGGYFRANVLRCYGDWQVRRNRDLKW